jgi:hypothetical protein
VTARRSRALAALIAASVFLLPILSSLLRRVPGTVQTVLTQESDTERGSAVEILGRASVDLDGTFIVHRTSLSTSKPERFIAHQQIRLFVATFNTEPDLKDGELLFTGTPCAYRTVPGARFPNNSLLTFVRGAECAPLQGTPTGRIALTLRFTRPARAALWTYVRPAASAGDALVVSDFGLPPPGGVLLARGTVLDVYPNSRASRLELLAYVWQLSESPRWILLVLFGAAIGLGVSVVLGWPDRDAGSDVSRVLRRSGGAFTAALALSATYAVLIPPFQAADEPNHFIGLVTYLGRPEMGNDATTLARKGHFEEIQFHADRQFSPLDRGTPGAYWNDGTPPDAVRGTGVRLLWWLVSPIIHGLGVSQLLLTMRLVHALLFSLAVAGFVFVAQRFTDARYPQLLALPLFLVPTLPYFGMHMSNYAPLISMYVLFAAAILVAFWDGPRGYLAGPLMAVTLVCAVAISRSAVPLLPFAAAVLIARVVLGDRQGRWQSAVAYWIGFTGIVTVGLALTNAEYAGGLQRGAIAAALPGRELMSYIAGRPWTVALAGALLLGAELAVAAIRRRVHHAPGPKVRRAVKALSFAAAAALALLFAASLWIPYPMLDPIDLAHPPGVVEYVKHAELACLTFLRFGRPDSLTSVTFWGGFGWLETLPPDLFVSLLATASGLALVGLLVWMARATSGRAFVWLACGFSGFVLSIAAYAFSVLRITPADLHGRYLVGLYLSVLVIAWSGVARAAESASIRRSRVIMATAVSCCLTAHAYCLTMILARYF